MSSRQPRGVKMYPWLQKPPDTKATNLTFNLPSPFWKINKSFSLHRYFQYEALLFLPWPESELWGMSQKSNIGWDLWHLRMRAISCHFRQWISENGFFCQIVHTQTFLWTVQQRKHIRNLLPSFLWVQRKVLLWRLLQQGKYSGHNWSRFQLQEGSLYQRCCLSHGVVVGFVACSF